MENTSTELNVNVYAPLRNQAAKTMTAFSVFFLFGTIQWIRSLQTGQLGIIDYWRFQLLTIPNDYKLIVFASLTSLIFLMFLTFYAIVDKNKIHSFLIGAFGIIPVFANLIIITFLFYLVFYRGIWTLSEFKNGFSFVIILKFLFFTGLGLYGYKGFSHFYQLERLLRKNKIREFIDYVHRYKLSKI